MDSTQFQQDMPRMDERGASQPEQVAIAWLCHEFEFGPSKASRLVRKFLRQLDRPGWSEADFVDFLVTESIVSARRAHDYEASLRGYSDPTGETAARNVDRAGGAATVQAVWVARYEDGRRARHRSVA